MPDFSFGRYAAPAPTPYHLSVGHLIERRHPELWARFAGREARNAAVAEIGLELARRATPMRLVDQPALYEAAGEISRAMGLEAPVTLYRGAASRGLKRNAALYFDPEHAHVVFEGDILEAFETAEIWYVIGHELAHHRLWTAEDGRLWTAHRFLRWAAGERDASDAFRATARYEKLYTEVFADRYGLWACGDLDAALNAHVKIVAGQDEASGAAYLATAEQALADRAAKPESTEPPAEGFVRAALLAAWARDAGAAEARARGVVEGDMPLERLDLLSQERLADITSWMLYEFLGDPWRGRDLIRAHAAAFSDTLAEALARSRSDAEANADIDGLRAAITGAHPSVRRYLAFVLLDFATIDPEVEEMALTAALQFSGDFGFGPVFKSLAAQELKITKTKLSELEKNAEAILTRAELLFSDAPLATATPEAAARAARKIAGAA